MKRERSKQKFLFTQACLAALILLMAFIFPANSLGACSGANGIYGCTTESEAAAACAAACSTDCCCPHDPSCSCVSGTSLIWMNCLGGCRSIFQFQIKSVKTLNPPTCGPNDPDPCCKKPDDPCCRKPDDPSCKTSVTPQFCPVSIGNGSGKSTQDAQDGG